MILLKKNDIINYKNKEVNNMEHILKQTRKSVNELDSCKGMKNNDFD